MTEKFCGEVDPDDGHNWLRGDRWSDEVIRSYLAKAAVDAMWQPIPVRAKPSLWRRFTYYTWRKWWYAYTDWLHKDCGR